MNLSQAKNNTTPIVLSYAGLDPSGGAGVFADIKTFTMLDVWGMGVATVLTSQDHKNFGGIVAVDKDFLEKQLEQIFSGRKVSGVKIGLINKTYQAELIYFFIKKYAPELVVLDPVAFSSSGEVFWEKEVKDSVIKYLLPVCDVVTPNLKEARMILNMQEAGKRELAIGINREFRCKVVVTGGDVPNAGHILDVFYDGVRFEERKADFIDIEPNIKHGTGCVFSSAVCAYMTRGMDFMEACSLASLFVEKTIKHHVVFGEKDGALNHNFRGLWI